MLKDYALKVFKSWMEHEHEAFLSLLEKGDSLLDLGCGDAKLTKIYANKSKAKTVIGVDRFGKSRKIKIINFDLNKKLPFKNSVFDIVISHYSLEHLYNVGLFISETYRVLKKRGITLVATDNMASWPNIISLVLGFQPFSTTQGICRHAIGNPFALRTNFSDINDQEINTKWRESGEYTHNKVLSYQGLVDTYREFGFNIEKVIGIGYFPFGGILSKVMSNIDKRHAHLLLLKARK